MARGAGAVVEDIDGNVFLDCAAGIAVTGTGHAHPDVVAAITAQAQKYLHMSGTDFYYEPQVQLAETMAGSCRFQARCDRFSATPGRKPTRRRSSWPATRRRAQRDRVPRLVPWPDHGVACAHVEPLRAAARLRADDARNVSRAVCELLSLPGDLTPHTCQAECLGFVEEQILVHLVSPDEVAAVLVEPIQGEGGYVVPPAAFHQRCVS